MTNVAERQPVVDTLNQMEAARLQDLEKTIRQGISTFAAVGEALTEIRDNRLYRASDKTFGDYTERVWGFSRQRAQQLIGGAEVAKTLSLVGVEVANEREARDAKEAAKTIGKLEPEMVVAIAQYLKTSTGSDRPLLAQAKAAAEVAQSIDLHATVMHPDTGAEVPYAALTGEQRAATLAENVSTGTHERMQRQQMHIQEKVLEANQTGRGGWQDWCMSYTQQNLTDSQELRIVMKRDPSGNAKATALIVDTETHATVAFGDSAGWLKKAVLNLVEEVKGV
ncbi:hypothetical protein [Deinococcus altitudinis]|uniref:hypothetical protein n=1 Tax=Deinococcus altitudinis TaxID=468914 RepID=UPI003892BD30